jgi:hypothetical protein
VWTAEVLLSKGLKPERMMAQSFCELVKILEMRESIKQTESYVITLATGSV